MPVDDNLDRAARAMMWAYKQTTPWNPDNDNISEGHSIHNSRKTDQRYRMGMSALNAAETAAKNFVSGLDNYPIKAATEALIEQIIATHDEGLPIDRVYSQIRQDLGAKFVELSQLAEWEFVAPISGLHIPNQPIEIGRCRFHRFTQSDAMLWMQRISTRKYDPPPNAPIVEAAVKHFCGFLGEPILLNQVTATIKLQAANSEHARAAGEAIIEESLNLWRYGQVAVVGFGYSFPQLQVSPPDSWSRFEICAPTDPNGFCGVLTGSQGGGTVGQPLEIVGLAPGWRELEALLRKPRPTRSELEINIATGLLWFGNAALARPDAVRLVSLVTGLEAVLLKKGEGKGIRRKLMRRTAALLQPEVAETVDELYSARSDCVHNGQHVVEKHVMNAARSITSECIAKLITEERFATCKSLQEVLDIIDPNPAEDADNGE